MLEFRTWLALLTEGVSGTYFAVRFDEESVDKIIGLQRQLGLKNPVPREKIHCTVMYSHTPIDDTKVSRDKEYVATDGPYSLDIFKTGSGKSALVLLFDSEPLTNRHNYIRDWEGGRHGYLSYRPHITLTYDLGDQEVALGDLDYDLGKLIVSHEYKEDLK